MKWIKCALSVLLVFVSCHLWAARIVNVRSNDLLNQWQFVLDASSPIKYRFFTLQNPSRAVIDMSSVQWQARLSRSLWRKTGVTDMRLGSPKGGKRRLVLDLKSDYVVTTQSLKPSGKRGFRLVINIAKYRHQGTQFKRDQAINQLKTRLENKMADEVKSVWKSAAKQATAPKKVAKPVAAKPSYRAPKSMPVMRSTPIRTQALPRQMRKVIVVIDPGHGGKDPGATGRRGTHEKNVVLAISKRLQRLLNKQSGFKAVLTRTGDYYLPLRKRLAIARKYKADMFVAIHADAFKNRKAKGASVYALSERGATSEAARWLAQRENKSELMGGVELSDKGHLLRSVLIDLSQTATISASLKIGNDLLSSLKRIAPLHHRSVEQAAFVVLKSPDIPSLLVETGFISNRQEEQKLRSSRYQQRLAYALMQGIKRYFVTYPPRDTWLAYHKNKRRLTRTGSV